MATMMSRDIHVDLHFLWQLPLYKLAPPTSTWSPAGCILNVLVFARYVSPYIPLSPRHDTSLSTCFFKLSLHISVPAAWNKCTTRLLLRAPNMVFKTQRRRGGEQTIINETKVFVVFLTAKQAVKRAEGNIWKRLMSISSGTWDENASAFRAY